MKPTNSTPSPGYEVTDASPHVVLLTALMLFLGTMISLAVAAGYYVHRNAPFSRDGHAVRETSFRNGPNQQTSIEREWTQLEAETRPHVDQFGWVDHSKGVVRIPVQRAMELMVQEAETKGKAQP